MPHTKTEVNGETYIVSDDANIKNIDFDNMVEPIIPTQKSDVNNSIDKTNEGARIKNERIWVEILFKSEEKVNFSFAGIFRKLAVLDGVCRFRFFVDRKQASEIMKNIVHCKLFSVDIHLVNYKSFYFDHFIEEDYSKLKKTVCNFNISDIDVESEFVEVKFDIK